MQEILNVVSVENSTIVDGGLTDRYNIRPLDVQSSETVRINDCLFENFAGSRCFCNNSCSNWWKHNSKLW